MQDIDSINCPIHSFETFGAVDGPGIRFVILHKAVIFNVNIVRIEILGLIKVELSILLKKFWTKSKDIKII